jgi:hypothetical protein
MIEIAKRQSAVESGGGKHPELCGAPAGQFIRAYSLDTWLNFSPHEQSLS